jgi:hypothetical protein
MLHEYKSTAKTCQENEIVVWMCMGHYWGRAIELHECNPEGQSSMDVSLTIQLQIVISNTTINSLKCPFIIMYDRH